MGEVGKGDEGHSFQLSRKRALGCDRSAGSPSVRAVVTRAGPDGGWAPGGDHVTMHKNSKAPCVHLKLV